MVCQACRDQRHPECRGGNWCDCQHLPPRQPIGSPLGWVRQG
jgi:hypothetical protein